MEIPVSASALVLVMKILGFTQFLKKMIDRIPFLAKLIGGEAAGWVSIGLTVLVAGLAGFQQYGGDGVLTMDEILTIIQALIAAMGSFELMKSFGKGRA